MDADAEWTKYLEEVLSVAQNGLTFSKNEYDIARFHSLRESTVRLLSCGIQGNRERIRAWVALDSNYATPKIDVRGIVLEGDRVLLVREASDDQWTLPGGWCDVGESVGDAVTRELREETGLTVSPKRLLALFDKHKHPHPPQIPHALKAFLLCERISGELAQSTQETTAAQFWPVTNLPDLSLHRVLPSQIQLLYARVQQGERETLFD